MIKHGRTEAQRDIYTERRREYGGSRSLFQHRGRGDNTEGTEFIFSIETRSNGFKKKLPIS